MATEKSREIWTTMNPDTRSFLTDLALSSDGMALTPELRASIEDNAIQDLKEQQQGGV